MTQKLRKNPTQKSTKMAKIHKIAAFWTTCRKPRKKPTQKQPILTNFRVSKNATKNQLFSIYELNGDNFTETDL
jgi:hypothetical protein